MITLTAGPELDRFVAQHVMGWKLDEERRAWMRPGIPPDPAYVWARYRYREVPLDEDGEPPNRHSMEWILGSEVWAPSTNDAHAWQVARKIALLCGQFSFGDGFFEVSYADSADHSTKRCQPRRSIAPVTDDEDDDTDHEPWCCHIHVGCMGEQPDDVYPKSWDHGSSFCSRGATPPEAICRAALLAYAPVCSGKVAP